MTVATWAIPVGTLSGLCVAMLVFVCWWFPRTWTRGTRQELEIIQERIETRKRAEALQNGDDTDVEKGEGVAELQKLPKVFIYTPQPVATY